MNKTLIRFMLALAFITILSACHYKKALLIGQVHQKESAIQPKEMLSVQEVLNELINLSQKGMTFGSPFNVEKSSIKQVKAEWGEADRTDKAGKGFYAVYHEKKIDIGYNSNGGVFDIRLYSKVLNEITLDMIEAEIGRAPDLVREYNGENIYIYKIDQGLELKFIFSYSSEGVHHISIFNPQRTDTENQAYILEIKGRSKHLDPDAWENMQKWRRDIAEFKKKYGHIYLNGPNRKMVSLTFDDGPDERVTPAIIDILEQYQVKANFFFLGSEVIKHPEVVQKAYLNGNLILSHSYHHVDLTQLGEADIKDELEKAGKAIQSVIGKEPVIFRPPYGETNGKLAGIAEEEGLAIVLWSIDTLDWSQKEAENILKNVEDHVRNGDIILMHSDFEKTETQKALPLIIDTLQDKNIEIVDLETLLQIKAYQ